MLVDLLIDEWTFTKWNLTLVLFSWLSETTSTSSLKYHNGCINLTCTFSTIDIKRIQNIHEQNLTGLIFTYKPSLELVFIIACYNRDVFAKPSILFLKKWKLDSHLYSSSKSSCFDKLFLWWCGWIRWSRLLCKHIFYIPLSIYDYSGPLELLIPCLSLGDGHTSS